MKVEIDVRYQINKRSGITTYTMALAEELADTDGVRLILRTGTDFIDPGFPDVPKKRMRWWDNLLVRPGWVRLVPHQMRPPPLFGQSVITIHDLIYLAAWSPFCKRTLFKCLLQLFRWRGVGIIAVSHATRSRLITAGFDPARVIVCQSSRPRSAVGSQELPLPAPPCGGGGIVYVGNLRPHKDVTTLIGAHIAILKDHDEVMLHIVTSGSDDEVAKLCAHYKGSERNLCVHRGVSDTERDSVIRSGKVCVAPSLEEGFGYSIDEALAQGTPVIASFILPHIENGLGRGVVFFPPGDASALQSALSDVLAGAPVMTEPAPLSIRQLQRRVNSYSAVRKVTRQLR